MPDGLALFDAKDRLIAWNTRYEALRQALAHDLVVGLAMVERQALAQRLVAGVPGDQAVLGVEQGQAVGHGVQRVAQAPQLVAMAQDIDQQAGGHAQRDGDQDQPRVVRAQVDVETAHIVFFFPTGSNPPGG